MGSFSLWHWLIVFGPICLVVYLVVRSRRSVPAGQSGSALNIQNGELKGIGGWLVLLAIGQVLGCLRILAAIVPDLEVLDHGNATVRAAATVEIILYLALFSFACFTTIAFFREKHYFVATWKLLGLALVLVPVLDWVLLSNILQVPMNKLVTEEAIGQVIGSAIGLAIWWWYLTVSVRVRNTFVN
jgi:hypothetical protein